MAEVELCVGVVEGGCQRLDRTPLQSDLRVGSITPPLVESVVLLLRETNNVAFCWTIDLLTVIRNTNAIALDPVSVTCTGLSGVSLLEATSYRDPHGVIHEGLRNQKRDFGCPLVARKGALIFDAFSAE